MTQVSAKLFAHIHNDPQLSSSPLEGIDFTETAGYLSNFLSQLDQKKIPSIFESPIGTARLSEFTLQTKRLAEITKPLGQLQQDDDSGFKAGFEKLTQEIMSDLSAGNNVFLPGGWVGTPGHAMLYELKPAKNGKLIFLCWNAGAGSENHERKESKKGFKFSPVKAYELSNASSQDILKAFLLKLLEPNVLSKDTLKKKFDASKVYNGVLSQVALLDGKAVSARPYANRFTLGQFSGTCAWAVLMEMLNNRCEAVEDFFQIYIDLLYHSINNFINEAIVPLNAQEIFMLKYAKQNLARHVLIFDKKYHIEISAKDKIIALIKKADLILKRPNVDLPDTPDNYEGIDETKLNFRVTSLPRFQLPELGVNNQLENFKAKDFIETIEDEVPISQLQTMLDDVLYRTNFETATNRLHLQQRLESAFLNLPLNASLRSLSNRELNILSEKLMESFEKYINLTAKLDKFPHGERVIACLSTVAFFKKLVKQRFVGNKGIANAILATANPFKNNIYKDIMSNPSFTVNNAALAKRLQDINEIFSFQPVKKNKYDNYLNEITYQNQALRLEASHVHVRGTNEKTRPGIYFLQNQSSKFRDNHKDVCTDLMFGMRFDQMLIHCKKVLTNGFFNISSVNYWSKLHSEPDFSKVPDEVYIISYRAFYDTFRNKEQDNFTRSWIKFKKAFLRKSFDRNSSSANQIQLDNSKINEQENLKKAILNIRRDEDSQVIAAIEFIQSEIERLTDPVLQDMMFALIFQTDLLLKEIKKNPYSINRLLDTIENGIKINQVSGSRKQPVEFFLQLGCFLSNYLASLSPRNKTHLNQLLRLKKVHNKLSKQSDALLKKEVLNVDEIVTLQFNIKIETNFFRAILAEKGSLDSTQIKRFTKLQFAKNKFATSTGNRYIDHQIKLAEAKLQTILKVNPLSATEYVKIINDVYGIDLKTETLIDEFPRFLSVHHCFNPLTGEFIDKKTNRSGLPLIVLENKLFKDLFKTPVGSIECIGHNLFAFSYEGNQYRISYELNWSLLNIYRRFNVSGCKKWAKLSNSQGNIFKSNDIPHSLMSDKKNFWIGLHNYFDATDGCNYRPADCASHTAGFYTTDKGDHKLTAYYHMESSRVKSIGNSVEWSLINVSEQIYGNNFIDVLEKFEDRRFIEIWQNDQNLDEVEICLPRYNLTFIKALDDLGQSVLVDKTNRNWILKNNQNNLIGTFGHYLRLIDKEGKQADKYIIPVKKFFVSDEKTDGARLKLYYDTGSIVNASQLRIAELKKGNIDDFINPTKFDFNNSEQYITAERDDKGIFNAQSILGKIHLAYIYLAQDKPSKALALLKQVKANFNGDIDETSALISLLNHLPEPTIFPKLVAKAKNNSPEHVAIKTYIVNIFASYRAMGGSFNLQLSGSKRMSYNETLLHNKSLACSTALKNSCFEKLTIQILAEYCRLSQYIPRKLKLKSKDLDALVSFCAYDKGNEDFGFYNKPLFLRNLQKSLKLKRWAKVLRANRSLEQNSDPLNAVLKGQKRYTLSAKSTTTKPSKTTKFLKDFKIDSYTLGKNKNPFAHKPYRLTIDTLNYQTCLFAIKDNLKTLYEEACQSPPKLRYLKTFLNKGIQANTSSQNGVVAVYGTLLSMINCRDVSEQVLAVRHAAKDNDKHRINIRNNHYYISKHDLVVDAASAFHKVFGMQTIHIYKDETVSTENTKVKKVDPVLRVHKPMPKPELTIGVSNLSDILKQNGLDTLSPEVSAKTEKTETIQKFKAFNENEPFVNQLLEEMNKDYEAGCKINAQLKAQNAHFIKYLDNAPKIDHLAKSLSHNVASQEAEWKQLENQVISDFYKLPKNKEQRVNAELYKLAKKDKVYNVLQFFLKKDLNAYLRNTNLNEFEIKQLHNNIYTYLVLGTKIQQSKRALGHIKKIRQLPSRSGQEYNKCLYQLGHELTAKRAYVPTEHLEILLFEFLDNKLIYKKQYEMLNKLIQKNNGIPTSTVIKLIMGGGKSKVLLPLLAKLKAYGNNLVCVEVPRSLFETNYQDLSAISMQIFGQSAHPFKFNRNMDTSAELFFRMKEQFTQIIAQKEFIITTRESIQSLELKLIDLLAAPYQELNDWAEEIDYLSQVINIIKHQGDAIMDEVDIDLNPRDQLIYTAGCQYFTDRYVLNALTKFFAFMCKINLKQGKDTHNLLDIVKNKQSKPSEKTIDQLIEMIPNALINEKSSPIAKIVNRANTKDKKELVEFVAGTNTEQSGFIQKLSMADKNILSLYRAQVKDVLKIALKRNYKEHFGLPMDKAKSLSEKLLAIPYSGAQSPKEYAKFKNTLLALNYTIQAHLIEELSESVFQTFIGYYKDELATECTINAQKIKPDYTVRNQFMELLKIDLKTFDNLNFDSKPQIKTLFENQKKSNEVLKIFCLAQFILPKMVSHDVTIAHDAQNHVDMYRSVTGFTGTDYNYRTFHPSIKCDTSDSLGTDGQTIDHLLRIEKEIKQSGRHNFHLLNEKQGIFDIIKKHHCKHDIRAIIDVGAEFKKDKNIEVAKQLRELYKADTTSKLKYILYFNEDDILCALPINRDNCDGNPIVLNSSDNLNRKLNCTPDEYFSFYDQKRTTGTDIKQANNTLGIVTASEKTTFRDLAQGANRFRDLKGLHLVEYAVMPNLQKAYPNYNTNWDSTKLINVTINQQAQVLMTLHSQGATQKINGLFRNHLMTKIRASKALTDKAIYADAFREYLLDYANTNLFEKYGTPEQTVDMKVMLDKHVKRTMKRWLESILNANQKPIKTEKDTLLQAAANIINNEVKICQRSTKTLLMGATEAEVVAQKKAEQEAEQEQEGERELQAKTNRSPHEYISWNRFDLNKWRPLASKSDIRGDMAFAYNDWLLGPKLKSLESIARTQPFARNWMFDTNITISENFYECCGLSNKFNQFRKPGFYVLMHKEGGSLSSTIITTDEAAEIRKTKNPSASKRQIWIETNSGIPYWGIRPSNIDAKIAKQREQINYFNGDTPYLVANLSKSSWLASQAENKMQFLNNHILPYHQNKSNKMNVLYRNLIAQNSIDPNEMKVNAQAREDKSEIRKILHIDLNDIIHKKVSSKDKAKLKYYINKELGKFSLAKTLEETPVEKYKMKSTNANNSINLEEMKFNAQARDDRSGGRPIVHIAPNRVSHKKVHAKNKTKIKSYTSDESGKITLAKVFEETPAEKRKMKYIKAFLTVSVALLSAIVYMYREIINIFFNKTLKWLMMQGSSRLTILALQTVAPIALLGAGIYAVRSYIKMQANKQYTSKIKIESIQDHNEVDALKRGLKSMTWSGYCESYFYLSSYAHLKAYYRGLEIGQDNTQRVMLTSSIKQIEAKLRPTVSASKL